MSQSSISKTHNSLQIHVTRKCNLKCLHCYSSSGPDETDALDVNDLKCAIDDAKALGFTFVTLSGGEPFLYPHMEEVMSHAHGLGLASGAVTNGMFLDERRLERLAPVTSLLVVSLDGAPERHNMMRANKSAFEVMARKLPALKDSGIPFGFLFTLSRDNAHELEWAADFAVSAGASMLQVHPLDLDVGRASQSNELEGLDPDMTSAIFAGRRAWDVQKRLKGKLRIIVDYRPRLPEEERAAAEPCGLNPQFGDVVSSLCIETDGTYVPMGHGFSRDFSLGKLGEGRLADLAAKWQSNGRGAAFQRLVNEVSEASDRPDAPVLQNIPQTLRRASLAHMQVAAQ